MPVVGEVPSLRSAAMIFTYSEGWAKQPAPAELRIDFCSAEPGSVIRGKRRGCSRGVRVPSLAR